MTPYKVRALKRAEDIKTALKDVENPKQYFEVPFWGTVFDLVLEGLTLQEMIQRTGSPERAITSAIQKFSKYLGLDPKNWSSPAKPYFSVTLQRSIDIQSRRADVALLHSYGLSPYDIAARLNTSDSTVYKDLIALGLERNQEKDKFTREDSYRVCNFTEANVLRRRLARGMTISEIAIADQAARGFVLNEMHRLGVEIPEEEKWVYDRFDKVKKPWKPGKKIWRTDQVIKDSHEDNRTYA